MKAYRAWDEKSLDPCTTIVFARNTRKAKKIAMETDTCEGANFIDIRVKRFKEADYLYKGSSEIDWYDEETRIALVRDFGWRCYDISWECERCVARRYCAWFKDETIEAEAEKALEDMGKGRQGEMKSKIASILKEYTKKNGISASSVILEDYAEQLVKHGVQPVIQCEKCKYWNKYGYDPIIEKCWGECCRPFGEDGVTRETAENDFCSFAKEATNHSAEKGGAE